MKNQKNLLAVAEVVKLTVPWAPTKQKNPETVADRLTIGIVDTK
jgi:hypothetical protein